MDEEYVAIQSRAIITESPEAATGEDLEAINKNTLEPLSLSEVFIFEAYPSNNAVDSYYTQMDVETTLKNYEEELLEGRALMNSHRRHDTLPLGYSFGGILDQRTGILTGRYYMQRGLDLGTVNTDSVSRGIVGGTIRDVSIGFRPGWYRCSTCGKDLLGGECEHVPGISYDRALCTAWVIDGHLCETSLVFDGATPGAIIKKAMAAYEKRLIEPNDVQRLEAVYEVRFPALSTRIAVARTWDSPEPERPGWDETDSSYRYRVRDPGLFHSETFRTVSITTGVSSVMGKMKSDAGAMADKPMKVQSVVFSKEVFKDLSSAKAWLENHKDIEGKGGEAMEDKELPQDEEREEPEPTEDGGTPEGAEDPVPEPEEEQEEEPKQMSADELDEAVKAFEEASGEKYHAPGDREIEKEAEVGRAYVEDLVDATVKARVRAQGDGFDVDRYRDLLTQSRDVAFMRGELRSYKSEAEQELYAGRRTEPDPTEDPPEVQRVESADKTEARLKEKAEKEMRIIK